MTDFNEKRRSARFAVDLFVEEFADGHSYLHPAIDLSLHGIYVLMEDNQQAVDGLRDVHIQFKLPSGHVVQTHGRIIHVDDHRGQRGARIAFHALDAADETAILKTIEGAPRVNG
jgi:hypothetical protein